MPSCACAPATVTRSVRSTARCTRRCFATSRYWSVRTEAEDVASETWAQASRDLGRFSGDADGFPRSWVTTIGRNRALDLLRRRSRRVQGVTDLTDLDPADRIDVEAEAEELLGTSTAVALLRQLPRDQAEAIMLRVVMGPRREVRRGSPGQAAGCRALGRAARPAQPESAGGPAGRSRVVPP